MKPTVLLADDHPGILDKLSEILFHDFRVVGAVRDGAAAVEAVAELSPDIVVMDISMPRMDGIQATRRIQSMEVDSKIIVLSAFNDPELMDCAFESGSRGYVTKSRMHSDLVSAIREVLDGRTFPSRSVVSSESQPTEQLA